MPDECKWARDCTAAKRSIATPGIEPGVAINFRISGVSSWSAFSLADALPVLAAAEHAAECATLNLQRVGALHRDRGVVIAAAVGIVDAARPFVAGRLHADQHLGVGIDGIAAEIGAALLDPHLALVVFGGPDAE